MDSALIWTEVLSSLQKKLSQHSFKTWISQLRPCGVSDDEFQLTAPTEFHHLWVMNHFAGDIAGELRRVTSRNFKLSIKVAGEAGQPEAAAGGAEALRGPDIAGAAEDLAGGKYTFENFVVGPSNQFAYSTAVSIAEDPGKGFNPFLIYGRSGVGKTHLLNAIGNRIRKKRPSMRVVLVSCERFVDEYFHALDCHTMDDFRKKYRSRCDALLLDDAHFLAGRGGTQDEFFHAFNDLHSAGKQMVFVSDRHPREIGNLKERVLSRFNWGVTIDIQVSEFETRVGILLMKARLHNIALPEEAAHLIARKVPSDARLLEGCLLRLEAYSSFNKEEITVEMAGNVLKDALAAGEKSLGVEEVLESACKFFNVRIEDVKSESRKKEFVEPRQIAMYLSRKLTKNTLSDIGSRIGGKDYSTVISAVKKVEDRMKSDPTFRSMVESIESLISG